MKNEDEVIFSSAGIAADVDQPTMVHPLLPPFRPAGGHSWLAQLPDVALNGNAKFRKIFQFQEDGKKLGRGNNTMHVDIVNQGGGLNSFWTDAFCFSTSDNSDPNTNGRSYTLAQQVDAPLGLWPLGGCTVYNPVYALEDLGVSWNGIRRATGSHSIYTHTPAEHAQLIEYLRGSIDIPVELRPFCNIVFEGSREGLENALSDTDVVLAEICSDVEVVFNGVVLNRLRLVDAVMKPATDAVKESPESKDAKRWADATQRWYYDGLLKLSPKRDEYVQTILEYLPDASEADRLLRALVAGSEPRQLTLDTLIEQVRKIQGMMAGKPIGVITHTQRYMPDGRGLSWPPDLHGQILDGFPKAGFAVLHPCELVSRYGATIALKEDLIHWRDDFMSVVGREFFAFGQDVLAKSRR